MAELHRFLQSSLFNEVVGLLVLAAVVGAIALRLHQPLIIAFIAVGVLAGPTGLGLVRGTDEQIRLFAELGLSLLLFAVGLRLDLDHIRGTGPAGVLGGLAQVVITAGIGYLICRALVMPSGVAAYVAIALTFSSTIIIVKLLSDKRESDSLHGRLAIGILIVQDIVAVLAMIILSGSGRGQTSGLVAQVVGIIFKIAVLTGGLGLFAYFVLPRLAAALARSVELLTLFSIAWAMVVALAGEVLGLSREVGAFLAGVSLASTPYREIIGARLVSLRDFLLLFFFIDLGMGLDLRSLGRQVWASIPLSVFVLIGKPVIVAAILGAMGYRSRTGTLTGLSMAQISEFSLILVGLGLRTGRIGEDTAGLVTLVGIITIGLSTYLILYSESIYARICPYLAVFERSIPHRELAMCAALVGEMRPDIILFGLGRYGSRIGRHLMERGRRVLGVDFDPRAVRSWNSSGGTAWFGDAEDHEFPNVLPLGEARWVISAMHEYESNLSLLRILASHGFRGSTAVTAHEERHVRMLTGAGADVVFIPFADAAEQAVDILDAVEEKERRAKMDKLIAEMSHHYIVCGYGRMGQQIVKDFNVHGVPHVVIESNPVQLHKLKAASIPHIEGKASDDKALQAAGVERAKGLIAVNPTDEENVFIVLTARGLNPDLFIIARSILMENEDKLRRAGANKVFSPYVLGGRRMAAAAIRPRAMEFLDLAIDQRHVDIEIAELAIGRSSPALNRTIEDVGIDRIPGALVVAVKRSSGEVVPNPMPDLILREDDRLVAMGSSPQIDEIERLTGR